MYEQCEVTLRRSQGQLRATLGVRMILIRAVLGIRLPVVVLTRSPTMAGPPVNCPDTGRPFIRERSKFLLARRMSAVESLIFVMRERAGAITRRARRARGPA